MNTLAPPPLGPRPHDVSPQTRTLEPQAQPSLLLPLRYFFNSIIKARASAVPTFSVA